ncbi:MAG: hypothetical protein EOO48_07510 [Flavobacterium sp.]|nr:MAG: hypothetical protein EOO48_07510 [Flavobacterium sp.]
MIAFFILLFVVVIVVAIDIVPEFDIWQSRIRIGRWNDNENWISSVKAKSLAWLKKTPTIKLTDNKRLVIVDMIRGNYKRSAIQHWQQAALVLGLIEAYEKTSDEKIRTQIDEFIETKIDNSGNWKSVPKEIDGVILAYAISKVPWIDAAQFNPAFDAIWEMLRQMIGADGTVQYRKHMKNYRYVDTIGFICPFLIRYGTMFNNPDAISLSLKQISEYNNFGMFPGAMLPCHTYNVETKLPAGLFGWGRGLGWYAIGLIDAWNELPENHPEKPSLTENVIEFAQTIIRFQNANGGWNWLVTNANSQTDSSAAATLAWYLSQTSSISELQPQAKTSAEKALNYLKSVTKRDGAIDLSQGDTKDIGVYSQEFGILPFAQGFALRATYHIQP